MADVVIETWDGSAEHARAFADLNREWLTEFFWIEPTDEAMLADPKGYVIDTGGDILFARVDGKILGVIALLHLDGVYELSKMGVTASARGLGIGRKLAEALIARARKRGIRKLYIASNRKLTQAITLYKNLGFIETPESNDPRYQRADITLELKLPSPLRGEGSDPAFAGALEGVVAEGNLPSGTPALRASPSSRAQPLPPQGGAKKELEPTRYGDWEIAGKCVDF